MEDSSIITLYHERNEQAIEESSQKYRSYCLKIAYRILQNHEDAEECVSDAFMKAWEHIPPDAPESLGAYLTTITRRLSLNYLKKQNTKKRGKNEINLVFHELDQMLSYSELPDKAYEENKLTELINRFLETLPKRDRNILLCRYYLVYPIREIAKSQKITVKNTYAILSRTLEKLKKFLEKENYL